MSDTGDSDGDLAPQTFRVGKARRKTEPRKRKFSTLDPIEDYSGDSSHCTTSAQTSKNVPAKDQTDDAAKVEQLQATNPSLLQLANMMIEELRERMPSDRDHREVMRSAAYYRFHVNASLELKQDGLMFQKQSLRDPCTFIMPDWGLNLFALQIERIRELEDKLRKSGVWEETGSSQTARPSKKRGSHKVQRPRKKVIALLKILPLRVLYQDRGKNFPWVTSFRTALEAINNQSAVDAKTAYIDYKLAKLMAPHVPTAIQYFNLEGEHLVIQTRD